MEPTLPIPTPGLSLETPPPNFGRTLLQFRLDADLSLAQAAEKAKITPTRLRTLEEGDFAKIDLHPHYCLPILERLCLAYGRTPQETDRLRSLFQSNLEAYEAETGVQLSRELSECLEDNGGASPLGRPSALLILLFTFLLLVLILGGCLYRGFQQSALTTRTEYDLPALLPAPTLPLDALPLP